jgi:hypothetical protein
MHLARGMEARRAETQGSVYESPVAEGDAPHQGRSDSGNPPRRRTKQPHQVGKMGPNSWDLEDWRKNSQDRPPVDLNRGTDFRYDIRLTAMPPSTDGKARMGGIQCPDESGLIKTGRWCGSWSGLRSR